MEVSSSLKAITDNSVSDLAAILETGVDINRAVFCDSRGETVLPISYACAKGSVDVVKHLLQIGVDMNIPGKQTQIQFCTYMYTYVWPHDKTCLCHMHTTKTQSDHCLTVFSVHILDSIIPGVGSFYPKIQTFRIIASFFWVSVNIYEFYSS